MSENIDPDDEGGLAFGWAGDRVVDGWVGAIGIRVMKLYDEWIGSLDWSQLQKARLDAKLKPFLPKISEILLADLASAKPQLWICLQYEM